MNKEEAVKYMKDYVLEANPDADFLDEMFDNCILGVAYGAQLNQVAVYSQSEICTVLFNNFMSDSDTEWESFDEYSKEDQAWQKAFDFAGHSIFGISYGDNSPVFVDDFF